MKREIPPFVMVAVLAAIAAVIGGLWWRSGQPNVIENPRVTMPSAPTSTAR
ncbi:MAG: hypothetical protein IT208_11425 [Chthonomonadales bacterium]|nr:hypothetical protein [Chthonomonadales bacterium]